MNTLKEVEIKTADQIRRLKDACQVAREVLDKIGDNVEVRSCSRKLVEGS